MRRGPGLLAPARPGSDFCSVAPDCAGVQAPSFPAASAEPSRTFPGIIWDGGEEGPLGQPECQNLLTWMFTVDPSFPKAAPWCPEFSGPLWFCVFRLPLPPRAPVVQDFAVLLSVVLSLLHYFLVWSYDTAGKTLALQTDHLGPIPGICPPQEWTLSRLAENILGLEQLSRVLALHEANLAAISSIPQGPFCTVTYGPKPSCPQIKTYFWCPLAVLNFFFPFQKCRMQRNANMLRK